MDILKSVMPEVKPVAFEYWRSIAPLLWAAVIVVLPEIVSDLSEITPSRVYWKWALRFLIAALKLLLDRYSHQPPATKLDMVAGPPEPK